MQRKRVYKSHWHCVYNLQYHLVLVTKYRKKCLSSNVRKRLEEICNHICEKWECNLDEFGGEFDHIHILLSLHPNIQPAKFINNLKTVTSRLIRKEFKEHLEQYFWEPKLWTRAYCLLSTGGAPLDIIKKYIDKQGDSSPPKPKL